MVEIRRTDRFDKWLKGLADKKGKALISDRIERLAQGCERCVQRLSLDHSPAAHVLRRVACRSDPSVLEPPLPVLEPPLEEPP